MYVLLVTLTFLRLQARPIDIIPIALMCYCTAGCRFVYRRISDRRCVVLAYFRLHVLMLRHIGSTPVARSPARDDRHEARGLLRRRPHRAVLAALLARCPRRVRRDVYARHRAMLRAATPRQPGLRRPRRGRDGPLFMFTEATISRSVLCNENYLHMRVLVQLHRWSEQMK